MNETWSHDTNTMVMQTESTSETVSIRVEIISSQLYIVLNEVIAAFTLVIALSGVISNAINIKTFLLMGIEDGVTVTFFVLSVTDFLNTMTAFVQSGCGILSSFEKKHGVALSKMDPFAIVFFCVNIGATIVVITTLTTTYLAVVRCLCVARPFQFKMMFTRFKSTVVLISICVVSFASHLPLFSHMGLTSRFEPTLNDTRIVLWLSNDRERVKDITRMIFMTYGRSTCQIIIVVCIVVMATELRKSVQFRLKNADGQTDDGVQKLSGKERSVVIQVVVICTVSTICCLAHLFLTLLTLLLSDFDMGKPQENLYLIIVHTAHLLDCVNSSVNFYIYYKFNSRFHALWSSCTSKST